MARRTQPPLGRVSIDDAFRRLLPALGANGAVDAMNKAMLRDDKPARLFCDGKTVDPNFIRDHLIVKGPRSLRADGRPREGAEIVATRALRQSVEAYTWEMDAKEVEALLPQPDTRAEAMQTAAMAATTAAEAARAEAATARAELEQARAALQEATEQMGQAEARAQAAEARAEAAAQSSPTTSNRRVVDEPRRKPGPKTKDDWPIQVAAELIQRVRAGEKMPAEMCQWCEENWGWQPDIRPMQRLFRVLLP